jgi:hypothetical protein
VGRNRSQPNTSTETATPLTPMHSLRHSPVVWPHKHQPCADLSSALSLVRLLTDRTTVSVASTVLTCALALLGPGRFPSVVTVAEPPPEASRNAIAFVRQGERVIYIVTSSPPFRDAEDEARRRGGRCVPTNALKLVASILAHEAWHLGHLDDEQGAYLYQLTILRFLGLRSESEEVIGVRRAMEFALRLARRRETVAVTSPQSNTSDTNQRDGGHRNGDLRMFMRSPSTR